MFHISLIVCGLDRQSCQPKAFVVLAGFVLALGKDAALLIKSSNASLDVTKSFFCPFRIRASFGEGCSFFV